MLGLNTCITNYPKLYLLVFTNRGKCYWVNYWAEHGYNYIVDAKNICVDKFYEYCDPDPPPYGIPTMPCASLYLAKIFAEKSKDYFWNAYLTCNCTSAQNGLYYANKALDHLDNALDAIIEENCSSNPPWKYCILGAIQMFNSAVNSAQGCINQACGY